MVGLHLDEVFREFTDADSAAIAASLGFDLPSRLCDNLRLHNGGPLIVPMRMHGASCAVQFFLGTSPDYSILDGGELIEACPYEAVPVAGNGEDRIVVRVSDGAVFCLSADAYYDNDAFVSRIADSLDDFVRKLIIDDDRISEVESPFREFARGDIDHGRKLIEHVDPDFMNCDGVPLLHVAARFPDGADAVLDAGGDIQIQSRARQSVLHALARYYPRGLRHMLGHGLDPNLSESYDHPVFLATRNVACLKVLLQFGANPNIPNHGGIQPIGDVCSLRGVPNREIVIDLLCQAGADVRQGMEQALLAGQQQFAMTICRQLLRYDSATVEKVVRDQLGVAESNAFLSEANSCVK